MAKAAPGKVTKPRPADSDLVEQFRRSIDSLVARGTTLGLAVSGGPDSLALLLLAAAARPGAVEAATVDHALRADSAAEAAMVAELCAALGVPHRILKVEWEHQPTTGLQARARAERYRLLGEWVRERGLGILVTAHHLDDQAETLLMRLVRGAGVSGLGAMRRISPAPSGDGQLARPLLGWRRWDLEAICLDAGVMAVDDPSNSDPAFERTRMRAALAQADWLDPVAIAASAANIAQAEEALRWTTAEFWRRMVTHNAAQVSFEPLDVPPEILRRLIARAVSKLASENASAVLRGREVSRVLEALVAGRQATLRGVLCSGGKEWRFQNAPARVAVAPARN